MGVRRKQQRARQKPMTANGPTTEAESAEIESLTPQDWAEPALRQLAHWLTKQGISQEIIAFVQQSIWVFYSFHVVSLYDNILQNSAKGPIRKSLVNLTSEPHAKVRSRIVPDYKPVALRPPMGITGKGVNPNIIRLNARGLVAPLVDSSLAQSKHSSFILQARTIADISLRLYLPWPDAPLGVEIDEAREYLCNSFEVEMREKFPAYPSLKLKYIVMPTEEWSATSVEAAVRLRCEESDITYIGLFTDNLEGELRSLVRGVSPDVDVDAWLHAPNPLFDGQKPSELLNTQNDRPLRELMLQAAYGGLA